MRAHLQDAEGLGEAFDHLVARVGVLDAPDHGLGNPVPETQGRQGDTHRQRAHFEELMIYK